MLRTTAIYFDGITSTPQRIDVALDTEQWLLVLAETDCWDLRNVSSETANSTLTFHWNANSAMSIKIEDQTFVKAFHEARMNRGEVTWYERALSLGYEVHMLFALGILGLVAAIYFLVVPVVVDRSIDLIPKSFDQEMGERFLAQYILFNDVDSSKTKSLSEFARQLTVENGENIKFIVVESSTVNAFALPDGTIVVFTGILDKIENYDELVALIGHEVAHVNGRHGVKMICHDLTGYIFISGILGDVTGIQAIISDNLNSLQSLSFSRQFENEADEKGLSLMCNNKINPSGMVRLFERLQQEDKLSIPEFLASHPVTDNRIMVTKEAIKTRQYQIKTSDMLDSLFTKIKQ